MGCYESQLPLPTTKEPRELGRVTVCREDPETKEETLVLALPDELKGCTDSILLEYLRYHYETFCTHEYDCCANWYTRVYRWSRLSKNQGWQNNVIVHLIHTLNV